MVSSLLHVLIVTPVIFFWLRERELKSAGSGGGSPALSRQETSEDQAELLVK